MKRPSIPFLLIAALSAVLSLISCDGGFRRASMLSVLDEADSLNRNFIPLTNDTLLQEAVAYFNRHGSANERMRAHYLLGCAYRDKGQSPMAVDCYQDAIDCADTTFSDCDYRTLSAVYSQMGEQYHKQLLFSYEIEARRKSARFEALTKNYYYVAYETEMIASAFTLLGEKDSAEMLRKEAIRLYHLYGEPEDAIECSKGLLHLYVEDPNRLRDAKHLIDEFDTFFKLHGSGDTLPPAKRQYYYYKGRYFEGINLLDSAEYYYRKVERPGMSYLQADPMYRGLLSVYKKKHQADSIAKYTQLYCTANDSSIAIKDQELTAQLAASYQYYSFQQKAIEKEREAKNTMIVVFILLFLIICSFFLLLIYIQHNKRKKAEERAQYEKVKDEYERNIRSLTQLEQSHKKVILYIQEELDKVNADNIKYQQKNQLIAKLNKEYEESRQQLTEENIILRKKVEELRRQNEVTDNLGNSQEFMDTQIAHRIEELSKKPQLKLNSKEKEELLVAVGQYFPDLLHDLNNTSGVTQLGMYVCILVAMQVRTNDIANMLGITGNQVSNLKQDVCSALFGTNSARKLYNNLKNRYGILSH